MAPRLSAQLERIEAIQAQLEQVLREDTLSSLEALTAEMGSRLATLLGALDGSDGQAELRRRLNGVLARDLALAGLIQHKMDILRTELAKAHAAGHAARRYVIEPRKAEALSARTTDLKG